MLLLQAHIKRLEILNLWAYVLKEKHILVLHLNNLYLPFRGLFSIMIG